MSMCDSNSFVWLGSNVSHCATSFGWSPDSRYFLTSTLAPRMNVDNGFKLFKYNGQGPLFHKPIERAFETTWQPINPDRFPNRGPSPLRRNPDGTPINPPPAVSAATAASSSTAAAKAPVAAYRPPGSTGSLAEMMRKDKITTAAPVGKVKDAGNATTNANNGGASAGKFVPSAQKQRVIPGMAPPTAAANAKKPAASNSTNTNSNNNSNNSNANKKPAAVPPPAPTTTTTTTTPAPPTAPTSAVETAESKEKRAKAIAKKLKQIQEIREKVAAGQTVEPEQLKKLDMEASLQAELKSLQ